MKTTHTPQKVLSKRFYDKHRIRLVETVKNYHKTPAGRYTMYKTTAKRKGLEFNLTLSEFTGLISKVCSYCGSKDSIGVDRVDNEVGYTLENSSPCCTMCNMMKKNLPLEIFLEHCQKITSFNS